ncbi:Nucleoid-associated protein YejK [Marinomonas aquimarina]|uniref:Nucleoid-associated protein YejK n=1 Tax=Marinomonas aquimarina TaxID=295068 RepID=A0A1A8TSG9_9GAMM|nr:nucleoid-associated protein [Marinomonas aquimarina]SBS35938.1 Nucleoid-associated protein YejK [Marinomonas aquimarina]
MLIKHVIIHVVMRNEKTGELDKTLRQKENYSFVDDGQSNDLTEQLTNDLGELFGSASLSVGEFGVGGNADLDPPFEQTLKKYFGNGTECSNFTEMTHSLANQYYNILIEGSLTSVKGGYLVFYQYESRKCDWLAVAIVNKTAGMNIQDQSLSVVASEILDLKTLHLAAAINLTKWSVEIDSRYIRFKAGRAAQIRDYFQKFIGCQQDKHAARVETQTLKNAIQEFGRLKGYDPEKIDYKVAKAHEQITYTQKPPEPQPVMLGHVANAAFPDVADEFARYAREQHNLPEELSIHNPSLRQYVRISVQSKSLTMSFDRAMVGKSINLDENGNVTISTPPDVLVKEIKKELADREKDNDEPTTSS